MKMLLFRFWHHALVAVLLLAIRSTLNAYSADLEVIGDWEVEEQECYWIDGGQYGYSHYNDEGVEEYTVVALPDTLECDDPVVTEYVEVLVTADGLNPNCTYDIETDNDAQSDTITGQHSYFSIETYEIGVDEPPSEVQITENCEEAPDPCDDFGVIIVGPGHNTTVGRTLPFTAYPNGTGTSFDYTWTGSGGGSTQTSQTAYFNMAAVGYGWVCVNTTDTVTACQATTVYFITTHDHYENFEITGTTLNYGNPVTQGSYTNPLSTPAPYTFSTSRGVSVTVKTSVQGSLSAEAVGLKLGIGGGIEVSGSVSCTTNQSVTVSVAPGQTIYFYETPFLNEITGTYDEWVNESSTQYDFTLDYAPGVSLATGTTLVKP